MRDAVRVTLVAAAATTIWACAEFAPPGRFDGGNDPGGDPGADLAGMGPGPNPSPDLSLGSNPVDPNDRDGDGHLGGVDCDDNDKDVYPGAPERCNGKDDDCDGFVDVNAVDATIFYPDVDGDGYGNAATPVRACMQPAGWVTMPGDCDDRDKNVQGPGGAEFCLAEVGPNAVFVSTQGNDNATGDSPATAVRTIKVGIARALKCVGGPCAVLIALGDYEEPVTLADGVHLFGGYSNDFMSRDTTANVTRITSGEPFTVTADALTVATRLDGLTITGADLFARTDGTSSYALWVRGSTNLLKLVRVVVEGGRGARGQEGDKGVPQSCDARGGQGGTAYDCGASTGAEGDAGGDPKNGGGGGQGGGSNCPNACPLVGGDGVSNGDSGKPGGNGAAGEGGAAATDRFGSFMAGMWLGARGTAGQRGRHGTGGGGGGAGGSKRFRACFGCGTLLGGRGADGAPGGCGGGGGQAGGAGGGAFALVLVDAAVTVEDSRIVGGVGGDGGRGGDGIDGQPGSTSVGNGHGGSASQKCGLINYRSGAGGVGGTGGAGGPGGGGAGGIGGVSVAVARVGASTLTKVGTVTVTPGAGGQPGGPGLSSGNAGGAAPAGEAAAERTY